MPRFREVSEGQQVTSLSLENQVGSLVWVCSCGCLARTCCVCWLWLFCGGVYDSNRRLVVRRRFDLKASRGRFLPGLPEDPGHSCLPLYALDGSMNHPGQPALRRVPSHPWLFVRVSQPRHRSIVREPVLRHPHQTQSPVEQQTDHRRSALPAPPPSRRPPPTTPSTRRRQIHKRPFTLPCERLQQLGIPPDIDSMDHYAS